MSVQTFDPDTANQPINLTQAAIRHLTGKLAQSPQATGVRLSIRPSGCSGYMYDMQFVETPGPGDSAITIADGLTVYIDADSLPLVKGTLIDFVKQGLNASIQFKNPNATGECGCGESFTVN